MFGYTFYGTYGSGKTPCTIYAVSSPFDDAQWYAVEGSVNVNCTHDALFDGIDVETINDCDYYTASSPITNSEMIMKEL